MAEIKIINEYPFIKYQSEIIPAGQSLKNSDEFLKAMLKRRSIRDFGSEPVSKEVIENILAAANTAPSGANKQPWTFCVVQDAHLKKQIREAAEAEEKLSYDGRMPAEWLKDLAPLQTDWKKPFLEIAPWLIVVFKKSYHLDEDGKKKNNYYVLESTGIATGFLIAAIHAAGLVTLTHTPSPMNFLSKLLKRPENEKPFLLLPVGYASKECWVPQLTKKPLEEVAVFY
ncbi:MAG: nitroreductase family protein [Ginsengibacter sp.]